MFCSRLLFLFKLKLRYIYFLFYNMENLERSRCDLLFPLLAYFLSLRHICSSFAIYVSFPFKQAKETSDLDSVEKELGSKVCFAIFTCVFIFLMLLSHRLDSFLYITHFSLSGAFFITYFSWFGQYS